MNSGVLHLMNSFGLKPWTQPVLTSNSSYGTVSASTEASGCEAFKALNGVYSGAVNQSWHPTSYGHTGWWKWELPVYLLITGIDFYNAPDDGNYTNQTSRLYTSSEMGTPIGDSFTFGWASGWSKVTIANIPPTGIVTNCIYYNKGGSDSYVGIGELVITAMQIS